MNNFTLIYTKEITFISICAPSTVEEGRGNRFVGLPLLIFTIVFIPPIFIGVHNLILVLMKVVLQTERSDRCRQTLRSENALSVIGIIRPVVVSPTPFFYVVCSVDTSNSLLTTGGEV